MARFWNVMACILTLVLCAMGLVGCAEDEGPLAQDKSAANASTSAEYVLASSYDEIYQVVRASLDEDADALSSGNVNPSDAQQAASRAFEELASEVTAGSLLTDEDLLAEFNSLWDLSILVTDQNTLPTAGSSDAVTLESESGYIYVVEKGVLSVRYAGGSSTESVGELSIGLYDELERWESASALYLEGDTLAVVGSLSEDTDWDPDAPDYALSAYAGARVMVAFFDVSDPSDPEYLSALGVTGTLLGFVESDGVLTVVASRSAVPAVSSDTGAWLVEDEEGDASTLPTRQEVADRLELRRNDAVSYVPAVYQDGALIPIAADRVYLPADGTGAIATVVATIDLEAQTVDSAFVVYSDDLEEPTVTIGEGVVYLQWASSYADEEGEAFDASIFIMRVPLEGAALSGVVGMARLLVLDGFAYLMSFGVDSATLYVCDAFTFELYAELPIEDETLLSKE